MGEPRSNPSHEATSPARRLVAISRTLAAACDRLSFAPPVRHVYNPLVYARRPHEAYLALAQMRPEYLLLGMNPGPFGMAQNGVPFGDTLQVRTLLDIEEPVDTPKNTHPKRPVDGFACRRREVSGIRLWSWLAERYGSRERIFAHVWVSNYCPLAFLEEGARNRTPDKLAPAERAALFAPCDEALRAVVEAVEPRRLVGVGAFAESRIRAALPDFAGRVGRIPHPSPASPAANRGWAALATAALEGLSQ